jgi:NAD(P)-dependent dehydrogenase (short-subunit alcohol dehydrogenase family)
VSKAAVAVVTGASRGIGEAIAARLAADGFALRLSATDEAALAELAHRLPGGPHAFRPGDLRAPSEVGALADWLAEGPVDVLVNNAGISSPGDLAHQLEHWDQTLALNVRAPVQLIAALAPGLRASTRGASIVNIGSAFGVRGIARSLAYVASKAALHAVTRALAIEYGAAGIRVNAVAPGFISTDMFAKHPVERRAELAAAHPLGRVGTPAEVAAAVSFLCSADSSFVSGAVLPVDGGLTAKLAIPDAPA